MKTQKPGDGRRVSAGYPHPDRTENSPAENLSVQERTVRLTIRGVQTDPDGNSQEHTSVYLAGYTEAEEGPGHVFRYSMGGDEAGAPVSVLFVSRSLVRMERAGEGGSVMIFDPSVPVTACDYGTPFGVIPMEVRTHRISVLDRGVSRRLRLRARVQYSLGMDPDYVLQCSVTIHADEIKEPSHEEKKETEV